MKGSEQFAYRAFISYSHATDGKLAPALQSALHHFAKPWYRLRAMRTFRDKTSLAMTPELWPSIEKALGESEYFLLLASPQAAQSQWVQQEVAWWLQHRTADRFFIVLTDGDLSWDRATADFNWTTTTALPMNLQGRFKNEPLYVDLRWARSEEKLSLRHSQFRATILDIAAPLHGKPKDELDGEDVREYRKTKIFLGIAFTLIVGSAVTALRQAWVAGQQRDEAERQRHVAVARQLAAQSASILAQQPDELPLSVLLALESTRRVSSFEGNQALRAGLSLLPSAWSYPYAGPEVNRARIASLDKGRDVKKFKHEAEMREVLFSPSGTYLAGISTDGRISLWNMAARRIYRTWSRGEAGLGLVFSRDGKQLATANGDEAFVWDVETGKELFHCTHETPAAGGPGSWIQDVALSPDGDHMATAGRDGTARVWSLTSGQEVVRLKHAAKVEAVAFSPDGTTISTASFDGTARLWELPSGRERLRAVHPGGVEVLSVAPDASSVASGGMDGSVTVWNMSSGDQRARMVHSDEVRVVGFSPDGNLIATGSSTSVQLWTAEGIPVSSSATMRSRVDRLLFSEDGTHLVAEGTGSLVLMDVGKGLAVTDLPKFRQAGDQALHPRYLAAWDRERRSLRLWETAGARELSPLSIDGIDKLVLDSTGTVLAGTQRTDDHGNGVVQVWALPEWRRVGSPLPIQAASEFALSPGGRYLAMEVSERTEGKLFPNSFVDVWEVATSQRIARLPQAQEIKRIAFHPQGTTLCIVAQPDGVQVWELTEGTLKAHLRHPGGIQSLRFSNEDHILATVSEGRVSIWDASTGRILSQLTDAGYVRDVRFSPNGRSLLTGSVDGTAVVWLWKTDDLQAEACRRLTRNLTEDEWRQYLGDEPYRKTCQNLP